MVAYSFKARFREPILTGTKRQTIRADRKRHARPGERLQLYTGMRTRQCKIIASPLCEAVKPIRIGVAEGWIDINGLCIRNHTSLDVFAQVDGFLGWDDMATFWRKEHPNLAVFDGILIRWEPLP